MVNPKYDWQPGLPPETEDPEWRWIDDGNGEYLARIFYVKGTPFSVENGGKFTRIDDNKRWAPVATTDQVAALERELGVAVARAEALEAINEGGDALFRDVADERDALRAKVLASVSLRTMYESALTRARKAELGWDQAIAAGGKRYDEACARVKAAEKRAERAAAMLGLDNYSAIRLMDGVVLYTEDETLELMVDSVDAMKAFSEEWGVPLDMTNTIVREVRALKEELLGWEALREQAKRRTTTPEDSQLA